MRGILLALVAMAAVGFTGLRAEDGEEKVPLDKLPKAITDAVTKRFPKAKMVAAATELDDKVKVYEVTIKEGEVDTDVTLTTEGVITGFESSVAIADLPKVVSDAVAAKYPKGKMTGAEAVTKIKDGKETMEYHEVVLTSEGSEYEVQVLPSGKVKAEEKKPAEEKKGEKKPEAKKGKE